MAEEGILARQLFGRFGLLFLCFLAAGCGRDTGARAPMDNVITLSDLFTGEFALVDRNGDPVAHTDLNGKIRLVYFGFLMCPDVCPGDINVMSATLNELGDDVDNVAAVFISVDPERDTPEALRDYFAFDERIIALTGDVEAVDAARNAHKLMAQKVPLEDSALGYTIQHQRMFFISDPAGQPRYAVPGGVSPDELAIILRRSIKEF